jgi:NADPH:quinone reductase-like Zn-dependent oxidoreductase
MPASMKRIVIHRPGGYDRLEIEEAPDPVPGDGEVLVDVEAIGVNFADCVTRMGLYRSAAEYVGWPVTPGFEVAGRDAATGRRVIALTRFGGYATRLAVPEDRVFPVPEGWEAAEAAAFPTVHLTAWYALVRCAAVEPGQTILVHSAAGGVGGALVHLGALAGATVVGVVGAEHKVEVARALGADRVVDRSCQALWAAVERAAPDGFHAVFDANGVSTLRESYRHLRPTGRLVVYGFHGMLPRGRGKPNRLKLLWDWLRTPRFDPLRMTNDNRSVLAFNLSYLFEERVLLARAMEDLLRMVGEGRIRPPAVTRFPFERVADAHRALETGETTGKLALVVDP